MLNAQSLKKYVNQYYSELALLSIIFLFFLELISDFVEAIYALCLLTLSLNENVLSVLFLLSPVVIVFFRKGFSDKLLVVVGELLVVCRVLEPLLIEYTQIKMIIAGIGVGCFLIFFPMFLQRKFNNNEELSGVSLGLGLALGLALSILFRTIGSSIDISTYSWFQLIGWILAVIAAIMIIGMVTSEQKTDIEGSRSLEGSNGTLKLIGLALGLIGILMMIYYSFASPTVITRWTEGDYFLIIFLTILVLTIFIIFITFKSDLLTKLEPWIIWLWNALFLITLVLTIILNQTQFPSFAGSYPIDALPTTIIHQVPLMLMLIFFPILFIDFTLLSRELINSKPTMGKLAGSFTFASLFFLIMIFAHVFTTVYDYIDIVGPLFRDMFWLVYLVVGLSVTVPVFLVKKSVFMFKKPPISLQSRLISIVIVFIAIGTILSVFLTTPMPTTPETATPMTVLTYNIQQGYSEDGIKNLDGQLNVIKTINPDIIGLQECDTARIANGNMDVVRYFANSLKMHSYYGPKSVTGTFGIALLSKYPIKEARTFFMFSKGEQTATIEAQIEAGTNLLHVFVTHLGNDGPIVQQEAIVKELIGKTNIVLMGDFNFRPNTQQYNLTTLTLNDSWVYAGDTDVDYLDDLEYNINRRVDHIFVSSGIIVSECQYIVSKESDHPVVWAKLEL
ncbi:MAG: endonuclease/exonuclease/phosphatase family protein [Candidatus Heimdallarchaeota archaeon]|nr:MAG: endonuclease/exonuclease/phosphatase family protein [Candidatus Heimdallarchaeota archaeon]